MVTEKTGASRGGEKNSEDNSLEDLSSQMEALYMQVEALKMVSLKEFVEEEGKKDPRQGQIALKAIETQMKALAERQRRVSSRSLIPVKLYNAMLRVPELEAALKSRGIRRSLAKEVAKEIED